jgi:protease II
VCWAEHHAGYFYVGIQNEKFFNGEIYQAPVQSFSSENWRNEWRVVLPHSREILRIGLDVFQDFFVLFEQGNCKKQMRVISIKLAIIFLLFFIQLIRQKIDFLLEGDRIWRNSRLMRISTMLTLVRRSTRLHQEISTMGITGSIETNRTTTFTGRRSRSLSLH